MTYTEFINNIINTRGQWAADLIYVQKHHIIPKCLGGQPKYVGKNCKHQNIIWLTPQEHYIAHELLALEHPDNLEIADAWWMMSHRKDTKEFINKEVFEQLSIAYAQLLSKENTGEHNPFFGKKHSKQTLQKISQKNKGRSVSDETRLKPKQSLLGVSVQTLETFGAVSKECAAEMAVGLHSRTNADVVVCTTGIAGPTGGTPTKPVGLMYVAIKSKYKAVVQEFRLNPKLKRAKMKYQFTQCALEMLRDFLSDISG